VGTTAPAGVGDLVAPKIEADPEAGFPRVGGPPKTGADPKADEVLVDPPKIEVGPFLANSAKPVGAAEVDDDAEEVPANCEKSTAVLSMPSCEAPLTPDEDGETEAETEAAKLENVGVLDETDA